MTKMTKIQGAKEVKREQKSQMGEVQLPVYYNKGGRKVKGSGTRFSPKGCIILTKKPYDCGTPFSLKITNPNTKKSIQVDSSVILRRHLAAKKNWGMVVRFYNLTDWQKDEIQGILTDVAEVSKSARESKYLNTPVGQAILRYFNLKKLID